MLASSTHGREAPGHAFFQKDLSNVGKKTNNRGKKVDELHLSLYFRSLKYSSVVENRLLRGNNSGPVAGCGIRAIAGPGYFNQLVFNTSRGVKHVKARNGKSTRNAP
jgi:hypothetical protein